MAELVGCFEPFATKSVWKNFGRQDDQRVEIYGKSRLMAKVPIRAEIGISRSAK
jgi:hypothetical protein